MLGRLGRLRAASPCTRGLRTKEYIPGLGHRLAEVLADLLEGTREKRLSEGSVRFDDDEANRLRPLPGGAPEPVDPKSGVHLEEGGADVGGKVALEGS